MNKHKGIYASMKAIIEATFYIHSKVFLCFRRFGCPMLVEINIFCNLAFERIS